MSARAFDLGVFRVVVFALLLGTPDTRGALAFAALSPALRVTNIAWLSAIVPANVATTLWLTRGVYAIFVVAALCALVGFRTRMSALIATLTALFLLGLPQLYGTARHYHHLVWFAAICAASPSGDALAIDAVLRARRGVAPRESSAHAIALGFVAALIGCIFFFPGWWKWRSSALAWAMSDNLVNQMHWKWLQSRWLPFWRIDLHPRVCHAAALATMIFEVGFVICLPFRKLRPWAALAALTFHAATALFMHIVFASLMWCYVAFVPFGRALAQPYERAMQRWKTRPSGSSSAKLTVTVGVFLVAGACLTGVRAQVRGWPFACYPTFAAIVPAKMVDLEVEVTGVQGTRALPLSTTTTIDSQRQQAMRWALALRPSDAALRSYLALRAPELRDAITVEVYRVYRDTDPERWNQPPHEKVKLASYRGRDLEPASPNCGQAP
ncbi:MAG: HTTM domain-containing protein [Polyangia bacterium]